MHPRVEPDRERAPHPFALTVLFLPFGMAAGYVTVTLTYQLSQAGLRIEQIAGLGALQLLPQTWKVLWAPVVDGTLSARRWYLLSTVLTGLSLLGLALVPEPRHWFWLLQLLVLLSSISSSFSGMSTEYLMAHSTPHHRRGRAGGWGQAGNLGGAGLGGGLALWMAQRSAAWSGGALLALICIVCTLALPLFPDPETQEASRTGTEGPLRTVGRDIWSIARSGSGLLTLLLLLLPLSTGAASGLWSAVAQDWHAGADTVAWVNGLLGGLIAMAGCLVAGYVCDLLDRKLAYMLFGALQALCALAMAIASRTPASFVIYTCLYAFLSGCIWAAFSAVALETVGRRSAATSYSLLACVSNVPITYMTLVDGQAAGRWGPAGMLYVEAALCAVALALFWMASLIARATAGRAGAAVGP